MSILFMFPGQGAQYPGMLKKLPAHPEVASTLAETAAVLGSDPLLLDTEQALASTCAVQLCLLIAGVAMARLLIASGVAPDMVAGLSIGAYPAAVICGALDYADAVALVRRRGTLMESAYPRGYGMAAIGGLDRYQIAPLIARVHMASMPVYLANLNADRQMVIAGSDDAMQAVMQLALANGATQARRLAVDVPSHCELFDAAADDMRHAFEKIAMRRPQLSYLSATAARQLFDPLRIADDLAGNMARQVHWADTTRLAWERGVRLALEMPPGSVLTRLAAPVLIDGRSVSCDDARIEDLLAIAGRSGSGSR